MAAAFPLLASVLLILALVWRGRLVETLGIHWDEYNFLDKVYALHRGELDQLLQTFHAHLFRWLVSVPGHEVEQILVARWVMFGCGLITCALLIYIGRRLLGGSSGVFAAFVLSSFWFVQHHGTSFRYDVIIATLALACVALMISSPRALWPGVAAGVLGGLAVAISIKSALYFPAFIVVSAAPLWVEEDRRPVVWRAAAFVLTGLFTTVSLLAWHKTTLAAVEVSASEHAGTAIGGMLKLDEPFPRMAQLMQTLRWDTPTWVLLLLGFGVVVAGLLYERGRVRASFLCVAMLASPLASLYFYRNAWPYYYVCLLPGASLLAGALWRFAELRARTRPLLALLAALVMAVPVARTAWLWYDNNSEDEIAAHKDLIAAVHEIFPEPVPYIDRCSMVSSYPKVGWFMSTWGMSRYHREGQDVMADLLREEQPKLLINNIVHLDISRSRRKKDKLALRPGDFATLKNNFIRHWGRLWVAGKRLQAKPDEEGTPFEILIEGAYTYEGKAPVELNGERLDPGDVVELSQGDHRVRSLEEKTVRVTLRYGDHLLKPERKPIAPKRFFRGFNAERPKEKWVSLFAGDEESESDDVDSDAEEE